MDVKICTVFFFCCVVFLHSLQQSMKRASPDTGNEGARGGTGKEKRHKEGEENAVIAHLKDIDFEILGLIFLQAPDADVLLTMQLVRRSWYAHFSSNMMVIEWALNNKLTAKRFADSFYCYTYCANHDLHRYKPEDPALWLHSGFHTAITRSFDQLFSHSIFPMLRKTGSVIGGASVLRSVFGFKEACALKPRQNMAYFDRTAYERGFDSGYDNGLPLYWTTEADVDIFVPSQNYDSVVKQVQTFLSPFAVRSNLGQIKNTGSFPVAALDRVYVCIPGYRKPTGFVYFKKYEIGSQRVRFCPIQNIHADGPNTLSEKFRMLPPIRVNVFDSGAKEATQKATIASARKYFLYSFLEIFFDGEGYQWPESMDPRPLFGQLSGTINIDGLKINSELSITTANMGNKGPLPYTTWFNTLCSYHVRGFSVRNGADALEMWLRLNNMGLRAPYKHAYHACSTVRHLNPGFRIDFTDVEFADRVLLVLNECGFYNLGIDNPSAFLVRLLKVGIHCHRYGLSAALRTNK